MFDFSINYFSETPSADEAEVYRTIQHCLGLREHYMFRESVAPWEKEIITDPSTPKRNLNPFDYTPEKKTDVSLYVLFHLQTFTNFIGTIQNFTGCCSMIIFILITIFFTANANITIFLLCSTIFRWKMEWFMFMQIKIVSCQYYIVNSRVPYISCFR